MSVRDRFPIDGPASIEASGLRAFHVAFGDTGGATLFVAALAWFGVYWRLGFFSTDQLTFANTLLGVAEGQLHIPRAPYGPPSGETPGTYLVDGKVYGRNYGIVVASAVWLLLLQVLSAVVDLRIVVIGAWSLAILGAGAGVGRLLDRPRTGILVGSGLAVALFASNLLVAAPFPGRWLPLLALQWTTALAAALVGVVLYRLVRRAYSRNVALFAGFTAVVGTPIGFWASLPKRHSVSAVLVVLALYTLYRSRAASSPSTATRFRALTYAWCGLAAWVHAAEGLILLLAIATVDLPTARSNRPRELMVVGAALLVSLLPFFATNAIISGNPVEPPRLLPGYSGGVLGVEDLAAGDSADPGGSSAAGEGFGQSDGGSAAVDGGGTDGRTGSGSGSGGGRSGFATLAAIATETVGTVTTLISLAVGAVQVAASRLFLQIERSFLDVATNPPRVFTIFVRAGHVPTPHDSEDVAVNLSVLASMPLLGALLAIPVLARRKFASVTAPQDVNPKNWSPIRVLDAFSIVYAVFLLGLILERLPVHHMLTVRYLHPLYAIGVYWLVRLPAVRGAVRSNPATLLRAFVATLLLGSAIYVGAVDAADATLGEAVQLYALGALTVAAAVAVWSALATSTDSRPRSGAAVLGVGVGSVSVFLLISGLSLFPVTGDFLLPLSRVVAESIHYARLFGSTPPF